MEHSVELRRAVSHGTTRDSPYGDLRNLLPSSPLLFPACTRFTTSNPILVGRAPLHQFRSLCTHAAGPNTSPSLIWRAFRQDFIVSSSVAMYPLYQPQGYA